ncbi:MAG: hypothetical protein ACI38Z_08855 [Parafannyhessea sp.]|uniref:hypothetical protein n=1 Tax=Parafannyhessea sp. TaxID=2847324 RepID=UPI003F120F42
MPQRPKPFLVDGKPFYTLSSYEPVSVTITIPYTTRQDVEFALELACQARGGTKEDLGDPAWVKRNFDMDSVDELRLMMRSFVADSNAKAARNELPTLCVRELASRLEQSVTKAEVARARHNLRAEFLQRLRDDGHTLEELLERTAADEQELSDMFDREAQATAEESAALDAFAQRRLVHVDYEELPSLLGVSTQEAQRIEAEAKAAGNYADLRATARRNKALRIVLDECQCTYRHETEAEAAAREDDMSYLEEGVDLIREAKAVAREAEGERDDSPRPHLRLV